MVEYLPLVLPHEENQAPGCIEAMCASMPFLEWFFKMMRERRRMKARAAKIRAQIQVRPHRVEEAWKTREELVEAGKILCGSLQENLGVNPEQLIGDDSLEAIFASNDDDMLCLLVVGDLGEWLGREIDAVFADVVYKMSFREAVEWLAREKGSAAR